MSKTNFRFFSYSKKKQNLNLKLPKMEVIYFKLLKIKNWIKNCQKSHFLLFFGIRKIKNWVENCRKSIFILLRLLKIKQKLNGRFHTGMRSVYEMDVRVYFVHSIFNCFFWIKTGFSSNFQLNSIYIPLFRFWI